MKREHKDGLQWWLDQYKDASHEDLVKYIQSLCIDWAETDTNVRDIAGCVLDKKWLEGDSYGVPGIEDIVKRLVEEIFSN